MNKEIYKQVIDFLKVDLSVLKQVGKYNRSFIKGFEMCIEHTENWYNSIHEIEPEHFQSEIAQLKQRNAELEKSYLHYYNQSGAFLKIINNLIQPGSIKEQEI